MLSPFDNFICKAPDVFLAKGYLQSVLQIFAKHVADANAPEYEAGEACKLIECVLLWCVSLAILSACIFINLM